MGHLRDLITSPDGSASIIIPCSNLLGQSGKLAKRARNRQVYNKSRHDNDKKCQEKGDQRDLHNRLGLARTNSGHHLSNDLSRVYNVLPIQLKIEKDLVCFVQ